MSIINSLGQVTPRRARKAIEKCIRINRPVFLWGPPGIGKSDIIKQIGDQQGRNVIDIRLALWDPTDIKGIPYYNDEQRTMVWAPPCELPQDPKSTDILFLDELPSAPPATQAAAYQLILNRRVGEYVLPKGVSIVAAGNREGDKGVTYRMPAPLANRLLHLELKSDFEDWLTWATNHQVHEHVVGYLADIKGDLNTFDPRSAERAFATPRSWSFVSDLLKDSDGDSDTIRVLIDGAVGPGIGAKFMKHREIAGQLPRPEDILSGKVTDLKIKDISAQYSLIVSLCYELKDMAAKERKINKKDWYRAADYFFRYVMDNFETELVVMAAKIAVQHYQLHFNPSEMKNFSEFTNKFGKYITRAFE